MRLEYISQVPGEAFLARVDKETDIESFAKFIAQAYDILTNSKPQIIKPKKHGNEIIYYIETKSNQPLLELEQIGSGKSKYFCVDKGEHLNQDTFTRVREFLYEPIAKKTSKKVQQLTL